MNLGELVFPGMALTLLSRNRQGTGADIVYAFPPSNSQNNIPRRRASRDKEAPQETDLVMPTFSRAASESTPGLTWTGHAGSHGSSEDTIPSWNGELQRHAQARARGVSRQQVGLAVDRILVARGGPCLGDLWALGSTMTELHPHCSCQRM